MQLWTVWLDTLRETLQWLAVDFGTGTAILLMTLGLRIALLPVSWTSAYRGVLHQKRLARIRPELEALRERFGRDQQELAKQSMAVYRRSGIAPVEFGGILGGLAQMPVLLGMFQMLREGLEHTRFLWMANLAKPDTLLAVLVGVVTAFMMMANPDLPEHARLLMIAVPSLIACVFALKFAAALGVYGITSTAFTALQTVSVHRVIARRVRNGTVRI